MPDNDWKRITPISYTSPRVAYDTSLKLLEDQRHFLEELKRGEISDDQKVEMKAAFARRYEEFLTETNPILQALLDSRSASIAISELVRQFILLQYDRIVTSKTRESENKNAPPGGSEYLLRLLLSKKNRRHIIGDLEEEFYEDMVPKFGIKAARRWYRWQAFRAIGLGLFKLAAALEFLKKIAGG